MKAYFVEILVGRVVETGIAIDFGDFTAFLSAWGFEYNDTFEEFKKSLVCNIKDFDKYIQLTELK